MNKRGIIIAGYPGVGKTSCANSTRDCVDLESSNFNLPFHTRVYVDVAISIACQGFTVFVSTHECVIQELEYRRTIPKLLDEDYSAIIVAPSLDIKDAWVERLRERYEKTYWVKDKKALDRCKEHYEDDISALFESKLPLFTIFDAEHGIGDYIFTIRHKAKREYHNDLILSDVLRHASRRAHSGGTSDGNSAS